jgi:hypothetical protein
MFVRIAALRFLRMLCEYTVFVGKKFEPLKGQST